MLKKLLISFIFLISIILSFLIPTIINKQELIEEENKINEYIEESTTTTDTTTTSTTTKEKTTKKSTTTSTTTKKSEYLLILEIPKIGLKKGVYFKDNKYNDVDYNIAILSSSSLPDEEGGNVILASHNGNTKVSYFKRLEELTNNDYVYIYYNGIKYTYEINKSEIVNKIGNIKVSKEKSKSSIVLISCKNGTNDKQIVYIGYLINKESY